MGFGVYPGVPGGGAGWDVLYSGNYDLRSASGTTLALSGDLSAYSDIVLYLDELYSDSTNASVRTDVIIGGLVLNFVSGTSTDPASAYITIINASSFATGQCIGVNARNMAYPVSIGGIVTQLKGGTIQLNRTNGYYSANRLPGLRVLGKK